MLTPCTILSLRTPAKARQVLILTLSFLLFGGSGSDALTISSIAKESVADEARSSRASDLGAKVDASFAKIQARTVAVRDEILAILGRPDWTVAELENRFRDFDVFLSLQRSEMLDLRFQLKDEMTPEEWAAMFEQVVELKQQKFGADY